MGVLASLVKIRNWQHGVHISPPPPRQPSAGAGRSCASQATARLPGLAWASAVSPLTHSPPFPPRPPGGICLSHWERDPGREEVRFTWT